MDEVEVKARLIALAEDRVKVAESLGLSESGFMAEILTKVIGDELDEIPPLLYDIDARIEAARRQ